MEQRVFTKAAVMLIVFLFMFVTSQWAWSHDNHGGKDEHTGSALVEEMLKLDGVFHEVVSGVALGDGERVHKALENMHGTLEKTHEGVRSGTVSIPKNKQNLKEFVKLDKAFHKELEALAHAAHENNQKVMLVLTKKLLDGCVNCHSKFRN
ncbi:MAG: cytochrome c [Nitrospirae bacterium]|nr:cytochrome c [Nitrospirota bacterium]